MAEMRTIRCEAGHDFQIKVGRGRPPKWCPDHRPKQSDRSARNASGREKNVEAVKRANEQRKENPFLKKAAKQKVVERLQNGKAEKKVEREKADQAAVEKEYMEIDARIRQAEESYDLAQDRFRAAQSIEEIESTGHAAEVKMSHLLNLYSRKRKLEVQVEQMTAPDSETEPEWVNAATGETLASIA